MVTATEPVGLEEANALLKSSKKGKLPVVNAEGNVRRRFVVLVFYSSKLAYFRRRDLR